MEKHFKQDCWHLLKKNRFNGWTQFVTNCVLHHPLKEHRNSTIEQNNFMNWYSVYVYVCACTCTFTLIYGSECRTQKSKARGANVVVMVTMSRRSILLVICSPMGKRRHFRGKEWRRGRQWDVWSALGAFSLFDSILVCVTPLLSAVLPFGLNKFDQCFSPRPLAPPDSRQQL